MDKKMWLLIAIIVVIITVASFGVSRLVGQSAVGGQATQSDCQNYIKNSYCNGLYSCTDCSLVSLNGYSVVIGGKSYSSVWKADCVMGTASGHTFCTPTPVTPTPTAPTTTKAGQICMPNTNYLCTNSLKQSDGTYLCNIDSETLCPNGCSNGACKSAPVVPTPTGTTTNIGKYCTGKNDACSNTVKQVVGTTTTYICMATDQTYCNNGCSNGVCLPTICNNECSQPSEYKCTVVGGQGYQICTKDADGCLKWSSKLSYCQSGWVCDQGTCINYNIALPVCTTGGSMVCTSGKAIVSGGKVVGCDGTATKCDNGCKNGACLSAPTPTPPCGVNGCNPVCTVGTSCKDSYTVETQNADCSTKTTACADGTKCNGGVCVVIPPVPTPTDKCDGVTCDDKCTADYTRQSNGVCDPATGNCVYGGISTLSDKCLPTPAVNQSEVPVPNRDVTAPTFFDKYGLWLAGGLLVVFLFVYIRMSTKKKGKKGRR